MHKQALAAQSWKWWTTNTYYATIMQQCTHSSSVPQLRLILCNICSGCVPADASRSPVFLHVRAATEVQLVDAHAACCACCTRYGTQLHNPCTQPTYTNQDVREVCVQRVCSPGCCRRCLSPGSGCRNWRRVPRKRPALGRTQSPAPIRSHHPGRTYGTKTVKAV